MDNIIAHHKNKKQKRRYFTKETEDKILEYNSTDDTYKKSKIYERYIHYPFYKLTENLIHTFKFYKTDVENLEDLQHEVIIFLLSKIQRYHQSQNVQDKIKKYITKDFGEEYNDDFIKFVGGSPKISQQQINQFIETLPVSNECREYLTKIKVPKAYSYFGTIAKNWLIVYARKNHQKQIESLFINDTDQMYLDNNEELTFDENIPENLDIGEDELMDESIDDLNEFMDVYIKYCTDNIYKLFPKKNDAQIADAILEMFRHRDSISIFNKNALYIQIKEIVDVKTPKITKIAKSLKAIFDKKYNYYLTYGSFPK